MQEIPKIKATTYKHPRWKSVVKVGDLFKLKHVRTNHVVIITGGVGWRESELFQNSVSCCRERDGDTVAVFEAIVAEELVDV